MAQADKNKKTAMIAAAVVAGMVGFVLCCRSGLSRFLPGDRLGRNRAARGRFGGQNT